MKRGQLSADFLIISAVVLIAFLFLFELYSDRASSTRIFQNGLQAQRIADDAASAAGHAWLAGNGSLSHSWLPDSLSNGVQYNISIRGRQVLVQYAAGDGFRLASAAIPTSNVSSINFTMIPGGGGRTLNFTNVNGTIMIGG